MVHTKETELIRSMTRSNPCALCVTDTSQSEFPTELKGGRKCSWNHLDNHYVQFADVFSKGHIGKSFKIISAASSYLDRLYCEITKALETTAVSTVHKNVASSWHQSKYLWRGYIISTALPCKSVMLHASLLSFNGFNRQALDIRSDIFSGGWSIYMRYLRKVSILHCENSPLQVKIIHLIPPSKIPTNFLAKSYLPTLGLQKQEDFFLDLVRGVSWL